MTPVRGRGRAFSILELLVVLGVLSVALAVGLAGYGRYRQSRVAQAAADMLVTALREQAARSIATQSSCGLEIVSRQPFQARSIPLPPTSNPVLFDPSMQLGSSVELESVSPDVSAVLFPARPWDEVANAPLTLNLRCGDSARRVVVNKAGVVHAEGI